MPKVKTKKIVRRRFKQTKRGKLLHRVQGARHIRRNKSKARQRRQDKPKALQSVAEIRKIKQFLNT